MATQSFIIKQEAVICAALSNARFGTPINVQETRNAIRESDEAFRLEWECEGIPDGGNPWNSDLWGTLGVNVSILGRFSAELRAECRALASLLNVHGREA